MLARPTLTQLVDRIKPDLSTRLTGSATPLKRAVISVLATVFAGAVYLLYGYLDWISKQVIPDTAEAEILERWAALWDVRRKPADFSGGSITFAGVDGTELPIDTVLKRADGIEYTVDEAVTVSAGSVTVAVTCSTAGATGDLDTGASLGLASPIAGINSSGTVQSPGLTGGSDTETIEELRARFIKKLQTPPQGGADADYEAWALEVPGVTRVWVYPLYLGLGTVGIAFVRDDDEDIIPDSGEVAAVQAHIDELRPVTASPTVFAPTAAPLNFTIALDPDTTAIRAAVQAELEDLILREAEPGGTILISHIREAVSSAKSEVDSDVSSPATDITLSDGYITTMGTITWV